MTNQKWALFLDDERFPTSATSIIARNSFDAIWMIENYGFPTHIDFDHDLCGQDTSMAVVHWIINKVLDGGLTLPKSFTFDVHSANPIGAENIKNTLNRFLTYIEENYDYAKWH